MKHPILWRTVLASALFSLMPVAGTYAQQVQTAADWYAPQTIQTVGADKYGEIMKALRKKDSVSLAFHYEKSSWRGLDMETFCRRFARLDDGDSLAFVSLISEWEDAVVSESGMAKGTGTPFTLHVLLKKVSKDAGLTAEGLLVYGSTIPVLRMDLSVEDGRWNDFSTLLVENGEKMGKSMHSVFKDLHSFPRLYNKQYLIRK